MVVQHVVLAYNYITLDRKKIQYIFCDCIHSSITTIKCSGLKKYIKLSTICRTRRP